MKENWEYINLGYLNNVTEGNAEIIKEMINLFIDQVPDFITELNEAYGVKNWDKLASVAHTAKTSVHVVGLQDLFEKLSIFEHDLRKRVNESTYQGYIKEFEDVCAAALKELDEALTNL